MLESAASDSKTAKLRPYASSFQDILTFSCIGDASSLKRLLDEFDCSTIINTADVRFGETPLMVAAINRHQDAVDTLLNGGANVNATVTFGDTVLLYICRQGRKDLLHLVTSDKIGMHDVLWQSDIRNARNTDCSSMVTFLLARGANVHHQDNVGETALTAACRNGPAPLVRLLLNQLSFTMTEEPSVPPPPPLAPPTGIWSWVASLAWSSHPPAKSPLQKSFLDRRGALGHAALTWASVFGHLDIAELLLAAGASVNVEDGGPLHQSIRYKNSDVTRLLLDHGAHANIIVDENLKETALMLASELGEITIVESLVDHGSVVNAASVYGETALTKASRHGHTAIIVYLLDRGANLETENQHRQTALFLALASNDQRTAALLLDRGANVNHKDPGGTTALHIAAGMRDCPAAFIEMLLNRGAVVNDRNYFGDTTLMRACMEGATEEVLQVLLNRGALVNVINEKLETALILASRLKVERLDIVQLLLAHEALIDSKDYLGRVSLMHAIHMHHVDLAECLILAGADVNEKDNEACTPLMVACGQGERINLFLVLLLLEHGARAEDTDFKGRRARDYVKYDRLRICQILDNYVANVHESEAEYVLK